METGKKRNADTLVRNEGEARTEDADISVRVPKTPGLEVIYTERYAACFELYLRHGGRNFLAIEREMRLLGYEDFHRRILYTRKERGVEKPGWIERFGWRKFLSVPAAAAAGSTEPVDDSLSVPAAAAAGLTQPVDNSEAKLEPPATAGGTDKMAPDFPAWLKQVSPELTWDWKYQKYIYKYLQRVTDGTCKRLMIFMPPRHGKSELVTVRYAGWRLWNDPKLKIIVSSYNQKLADRFSRGIRKLLSEEEDKRSAVAGVPPSILTTPSRKKRVPPFLRQGGEKDNSQLPSLSKEGWQPDAFYPADGVVTAPPDIQAIDTHARLRQRCDHPQCGGIAADHIYQPDGKAEPFRTSGGTAAGRMFPKTRTINTASQWETAVGGGVKAVGVGAGVTGFGGQLIIIDDPVKSRAEAESPTYRERLWDWYRNDLYTRLEPNAAVILIQTRWHQDDLAGRLLQEMQTGGDHWEVVDLPALSEPAAVAAGSDKSDPLGRPVGAALCPDRFDETKLADIQRQLGSYNFAALYQQHPTPAEGGIFKRAWFTKFVDRAPDGLRWKRGYDLAVSTKTTACFTASFRVARDAATGNLYIADGFRERIEYPDQKRYIIDRLLSERDTEHGIEKAIHGEALIQDLRQETRVFGKHMRGIDVTNDKVTRALTWAPLAEEGKVILVRGPWNRAFLDEIANFPAGAHDDQIDAVSLAFSMLENKRRQMWSF
jgi:predicted phage terminase large subunit-like protein